MAAFRGHAFLQVIQAVFLTRLSLEFIPQAYLFYNLVMAV